MEIEISNDQLLEGNDWYSYLEKYLIMREELMFEEYDKSFCN